MTKRGVRWVLPVLMIVAFLVFCGVDHALASSYSARGDLTALSSSSGPQTLTYDALHRLVSSTDATGYQVQYAYDAGSRLTSETTSLGTSTFAWDLLDRATQVTDPQSHVTSYTYDAVGRRLAMLSPNALATQYTYDASSRITELRLINSTTQAQLLDTLITYDANGNVLTSGPDAYTYDATQQLASWTRADVPTSYTYDGRGNLTSITGPSGTTSFTVDPATNRLLTMTVPGQYTDTWTYDAAGNSLTRTRLQNGTTQLSSYTWDALGKLSSVIRQGQTTLTFAYAPDGTLSRKEQGTQVTTYAHDVAGVSRETNGSSPVTYQHNGAGELVSLTWNNQTCYYHFNAHGDTVALSDGTGTRVAEYAYDPWGTVTTNTNPAIPNPYLYCGAYGVRWDADLSLYLMGARWYNPATGRFLTRDSYPPDLLAPLTQNPYQYCGNNPVKNIDPQGHEAIAAATGWLVMTVGTAIAVFIIRAVVPKLTMLLQKGKQKESRPRGLLGTLIDHLAKYENNVTNPRWNGDPHYDKHKHEKEVGSKAREIRDAVEGKTDGEIKNFFIREYGATRDMLEETAVELDKFIAEASRNALAGQSVENAEWLLNTINNVIPLMP